MAIPICIHVPLAKDPFAIMLPGGVQLEHMRLADVIQPALTPLAPIFTIIDVIAALYACQKAVVDSIQQLSPGPLLSSIPELAEKMTKLLSIIPALSLPLTVVGLLDMLIGVLSDVRDQVLNLQAELERMTWTVDRAKELDDANLLRIAGCVEENVAQEAANIGKQLGSMGKLIGLINVFMGMIGGPEIPDFSGLSGQPVSEVLAPLDSVVTVLRDVRRAIPVP